MPPRMRAACFATRPVPMPTSRIRMPGFSPAVLPSVTVVEAELAAVVGATIAAAPPALGMR